MPNYFAATNVQCVRNDHTLFSSINLNLNPGDVVHIRGENGVGKTTLLRTFAGLSRPHHGEISWQDKNIFEDESYKNDLFFLGHKSSIKSALTPKENLFYSVSLNAVPHIEKVVTALQKVGLESKINHATGTLSAGQKQRLALAKLLMSSAKLWILDEPFTSLDSHGFELLEGFFQKHLSNQGMIIFTSHQLLTGVLSNYSSLELSPSDLK